MDEEETIAAEKIVGEAYAQGYWDRREEEIGHTSNVADIVIGIIIGISLILFLDMII